MKKITICWIVSILIMVVSNTTVFASNEINLTEQEQKFIDNHPIIKLGIDPKFVPFEFIDENGNYSGISSDYLKIISEKTGLVFEIAEDLTWVEAYDLAISKELDALPAVSKTQAREEHFLFSDSYYNYQRVIVTRNDETEIRGLDDLDGLSVAIQKNSSHESYLSSLPTINLSLYESVEAAISAVANGNERVFVGNLASTNYIIQNSALTNLKFIAFEAEKRLGIHFAVRKDWPELISIINKVYDSMSEEERIVINSKWVSIDSTYDFGPILQISLIVLLILGIVIGVSFYWIAKLREEVNKRIKIQKDLEKAKREAEEANAFKSSFMARMSHEIRTPLHAISGMTHLIKNTQLSLTQKMYMDRVTQAASNMLSIVNDILDYSKIEAGKVELEIDSFSLDQSIQNVVNIIAYKIEEQDISFDLIKDPGVANWFYGDQKRVEQILLNLLNNAVKFTTQGEVTFKVSVIVKQDDIYHLNFSISDTGIGMTNEQVEKLFSPFEQGDSSINRRFGGSGLGLSIVKNLTEMMGGEVKVYSTIDVGTTFVVNIPLRVDTKKDEAEIKNLVGDNFKNISTLVVDKATSNTTLIESYLNSLKINCEVTSSLVSARNMLEAANGKFVKAIDLLIIDYDAIDGNLQSVQDLKHNRRIHMVPYIIVLLPIKKEDLLEKLKDYEIDLGIIKPIIPSVLLNGIVDLFKLKALNQPILEDTSISEEKKDSKGTILLVEDNLTNQLIAKTTLIQAGYDVITATNGQLAIDEFKKHQNEIQVILMDLHMPILNGYDAAKKISEISSDIVIVAMSADVIMGVKEKCEQSGMHHYISKPFNPNQLLELIKSLINNQKDTTKQNADEVLIEKIGLNNVANDKDFYKIVLNEFYIENQDSMEQLDDLLTNKDYKEASQVVHKIKGSSGSIGALQIHKLSIEFQEALKNEDVDAVEQIRKTYLSRFLELLKAIEKIIKD